VFSFSSGKEPPFPISSLFPPPRSLPPFPFPPLLPPSSLPTGAGHTRGTKTIQFTLDSPSDSQKGWALKKTKVRNYHGNKVTAAVRKSKNTKKKVEVFSEETLERLKAQMTPRLLDQRFFNSGKPYLTILPDRTGYCKYLYSYTALYIIMTI
jgi:hypothetical protein